MSEDQQKIDELHKILGKKRTEIKELRTQLTAETENSTRLACELSTVKTQLAATQAVIERVDKTNDVRWSRKQPVDALDAATKPLVDALTQIADEKRHGAAAWRIAKDALAQVK